ncbi:MAG: copper resistance protein CopC, partial [Propionibacteriales bacterium]|nr:copper resistance protein CopC [Propionibacteriales bacterium]
MPRVRAAACLGAGIFVTLFLGALPAYAHASLVSTNPEDGAIVQRLPSEVSATFSENVGKPAYLVVTAPNGDDATAG